MKLIDLSNDEQRIRSVYKVLAIIAGIVIAGTGSYGVVATTQLGVEVVGETLVTVEFPPIEGFPLYKPKPVTWLMSALFVLAYAGLNLNRKLISTFPPFVLQSLKLFSANWRNTKSSPGLVATRSTSPSGSPMSSKWD